MKEFLLEAGGELFEVGTLFFDALCTEKNFYDNLVEKLMEKA